MSLNEFQKIQLPKAIVYLTSSELNRLLLRDIELYKLALSRGKYIKRNESLNERVQLKRDEFLH